MSEIVVPEPKRLRAYGLSLVVPAQVNRSKWTGTRKVVGLPGAETWKGKVRLPSLNTEAIERPWRAFLFGLKGQENWFRFLLPCNATYSSALPTVRAGAGDAYTLPLAGLPVSSTALLAGQFITVQLPSGLHRAAMLTQNLVSNSSGEGTATLNVALTEIPAAGTAVEVINPFVPMASVNQELGLATVDGISGAEFDVEEAR